jgi:hypothetical protein
LSTWFIGADEISQLDIQYEEVGPGQYVFTEPTSQFAIDVSLGGAAYNFVYQSDTLLVGQTGDIPLVYAWQQCGWIYTQSDTLFGVTSRVDEKISDIQFYPNPAKDKLTIEHEMALMNSKVSIYDVVGNLIISIPVSIGNKKIHIPISTLTKGNYFGCRWDYD